MGELSPGKQNPPVALAAFQSNICPQPDDDPLVASAGMVFAQLNTIMQPEVSQHVKIIPPHVIIEKQSDSGVFIRLSPFFIKMAEVVFLFRSEIRRLYSYEATTD